MKKQVVKIQDIKKLIVLFQSKNWFKNPNQENVFENFCNLLNNLTEEQKTLIHELSEQYLWVTNAEYGVRFNDLLNKIDEAKVKNCKTLYLFPIIKKVDENKLKSGDHSIYILKGHFALNAKYNSIDIELIQTFDELRTRHFKNDGSELIFFIDDFIGSSETFEETWLEALKNPTITFDITYILTLVIQTAAFNYIYDNYSLSPLFTESRAKGINDFYPNSVKAKKIEIMKDIERIFNPKSNSFGYKQSEALVTMIRTPDNTFPVFWMRYTVKGENYIPPFLRL
jgi:hypothetical protein